jgi:hypothetical protein
MSVSVAGAEVNCEAGMLDWLQGTWEDAMRHVAERRVLRRYCKRADALEDRARQIRISQEARQQLGELGVPEERINALLEQQGRGELTRGDALSQFRAAVPGISEQLGNVPAAAGTAFTHGRIGSGLGQLDVLGLKNLASPLSLAGAATAGLGTYGLGRRIATNRDLWDVARGTYPGDPLMPKKSKRDGRGPLLSEWRAKKEKSHSANTAWREFWDKFQDIGIGDVRPFLHYLNEKIQAAPGKVWSAISGPPEKMIKGRKGRAIYRGTVERALERAQATPSKDGKPPYAGGFLRRRGPLLAGLAAASLPLLASEWLSPSGYRSGVNPFGKLLDVNQNLAQQPPQQQPQQQEDAAQ